MVRKRIKEIPEQIDKNLDQEIMSFVGSSISKLREWKWFALSLPHHYGGLDIVPLG